MKNIGNLGDLLNLFVRTRLIDINYPLKGCHVLMPDGFKLRDRFFSGIEGIIEKRGYKRYQFPILTSGECIRKITEGIEDYEDGLFWLRRKNGALLDVFLSPVGESAIYTMFQRWIKKQSDLPLRLYLQGPTFRLHHDPSIMLNEDETSTTLEGHSAFSSTQEADSEYRDMIQAFQEFLQEVGIPHLQLRRPRTGNKLCYNEMVSLDTFLPSRKTSLNVAVVYNQGQVYSEVFGVEFFDAKSGEKKLTQQITFGIRERAILAMLDLHRDFHGLRFLPELAPTQILVLPVHSKESDDNLDKYAQEIADQLRGEYRVIIDTSHKRYGKKVKEARENGIPVRIGVNADNLVLGTARCSLRTDEDNPIYDIYVDDIAGKVNRYFKQIRGKIIKDAEETVRSSIVDVRNISDLGDVVSQGFIARLYFCGNDNCYSALSRSSTGEMIGTALEGDSGSCVVCREKSDTPSYYSRRAPNP